MLLSMTPQLQILLFLRKSAQNRYLIKELKSVTFKFTMTL